MELTGGLTKIRIGEGVLNFDYAHFLPAIEKCSTIHGHTASLDIEVVGEKRGPGLVIDFGLLKSIAREIISNLDHKIIVCEKYLEWVENGAVSVRFSGRGGEYRLIAPASQVFIAPFESTIENITAYIADSLMSRMPENVVYVRVVASEGIGKSAESIKHRDRHG